MIRTDRLPLCFDQLVPEAGSARTHEARLPCGSPAGYKSPEVSTARAPHQPAEVKRSRWAVAPLPGNRIVEILTFKEQGGLGGNGNSENTAKDGREKSSWCE